MPDRDGVADMRGHASAGLAIVVTAAVVIAVDDRPVLDIGILADPDAIDVAAQDAAVPDRRSGSLASSRDAP